MEPLPEVVVGVDRLAAVTGDTSLLDALRDLGDLAVSLVPSCVAVSLTVVVDDEPVTLTATSTELAVLDAAQYLEGGPCVEATEQDRRVSVVDVLDEERWQLYQRAAAARGVRSSLSMPLAGRAASPGGAVNLYASDPHAFTGHEDAVAAAFAVPVEALVADADLSFATRDLARRLPDLLEERASVDRAVGLLMGRHGWGAEEARERLRAAAGKAGVAIGEVAAVVRDLEQI